MVNLKTAIPMRWPSGPLEAARRKNLTAEAQGALQSWHQPAALKLLHGSPVNCLIVTWAGGLRQDAEQQMTLLPLIAAGKEAGLSMVGWVDEKADKPAAIAAARSAGLDAVVMESCPTKVTGLPVVLAPPRDKVDWGPGAPFVAVSDNLWPGVAAIKAGATGAPWLDSNGWFLQMARARTHFECPWLILDPPGDNTIVEPGRYLVTIADAGAFGARWAVSLDDHLRSGLASGQQAATQAWQKIAASVGFFERQRAWRQYEPITAVAVVSDFEAPNDFLSRELLNLLTRRRLPFRVVEKRRLADASFTVLQAIVSLDVQPLEKALQAKLLRFVADGGLLLAPRSWDPRPASAVDVTQPRFDVFRVGKGRLAISREDSPDPYFLAADLHVLLSHNNDLFRLYNAGAQGCYYVASHDGRSDLLHVINYSDTERELMTVWFRKSYRTARLWTLGSSEPAALKLSPQKRGVEVYLPTLCDYAAVELAA